MAVNQYSDEAYIVVLEKCENGRTIKKFWLDYNETLFVDEQVK